MSARGVRLLGWAIVAVAFIALLLLPENRYDWMREMDPTIPPGAIVDRSDDAHVAASVTALAGVGVAVLLAVTRSGRGRWAAAVAGALVAGLWAVKFAG